MGVGKKMGDWAMARYEQKSMRASRCMLNKHESLYNPFPSLFFLFFSFFFFLS